MFTSHKCTKFIENLISAGNTCLAWILKYSTEYLPGILLNKRMVNLRFFVLHSYKKFDEKRIMNELNKLVKSSIHFAYPHTVGSIVYKFLIDNFASRFFHSLCGNQCIHTPIMFLIKKSYKGSFAIEIFISLELM